MTEIVDAAPRPPEETPDGAEATAGAGPDDAVAARRRAAARRVGAPVPAPLRRGRPAPPDPPHVHARIADAVSVPRRHHLRAGALQPHRPALRRQPPGRLHRRQHRAARAVVGPADAGRRQRAAAHPGRAATGDLLPQLVVGGHQPLRLPGAAGRPRRQGPRAGDPGPHDHQGRRRHRDGVRHPAARASARTSSSSTSATPTRRCPASPCRCSSPA